MQYYSLIYSLLNTKPSKTTDNCLADLSSVTSGVSIDIEKVLVDLHKMATLFVLFRFYNASTQRRNFAQKL